MAKRKRGTYRKYKPRKRLRTQKRKYRSRLRKSMTYALETKRRYFNEQNLEMKNGYKYLYQPFNYMAQGSIDSQIDGNTIFIQSFHIKGKIAGFPDNVSGTTYAGPMVFHIYLVSSNAEVQTGVIAEGMTSNPTLINTWFNGSTNPSEWYTDTSRCKVLYHKKLNYVPNAENAWAIGGLNSERAGKEMDFYCKKTLNKSHQFRETTTGVVSSFFGKWTNYYWVFVAEQPLGYSDVKIRVNYTTLTTYKDK